MTREKSTTDGGNWAGVSAAPAPWSAGPRLRDAIADNLVSRASCAGDLPAHAARARRQKHVQPCLSLSPRVLPGAFLMPERGTDKAPSGRPWECLAWRAPGVTVASHTAGNVAHDERFVDLVASKAGGLRFANAFRNGSPL